MLTITKENSTLSVDLGANHQTPMRVWKYYIPSYVTALKPAKYKECGGIEETRESWLGYITERVRLLLGYDRGTLECVQLRNTINAAI